MIPVSVIIPNYNHAPFLEKRITSVLAQTHPAAEIILLDDASTDHSRQIIEQYRSHPLVSHIQYNESNSGSPFKQWEKGIQLAKHDWVWIAESDDACSPDFLEAAVHCILANPQAGLYCCNSAIESQGAENSTTAGYSNRLLHAIYWNESFQINGTDEINRSLKYHSVIPNASAVVFRTKKLAEAGNQLGRFRYYGDWYAWIKILADTGLIYDHVIRNHFRRTGESHSKKMTAADRLHVKTDCFRILQLLRSIPGVTDKKNLTRWFIRNHTGFGLLSDGPLFIFKLLIKYYSINFKLATIVLVKSIALKFSRDNQ